MRDKATQDIACLDSIEWFLIQSTIWDSATSRFRVGLLLLRVVFIYTIRFTDGGTGRGPIQERG